MTTTHPIKRTHNPDRPVTLYLRAAGLDTGPYYLVDRAGYGVSWRGPETTSVVVGVDHRPCASTVSRRVSSWVPTFERARLAFELCELDPTVTAKEAKAAADWAAKRLGRATGLDVVAFAHDKIESDRHRARERAAKADGVLEGAPCSACGKTVLHADGCAEAG